MTAKTSSTPPRGGVDLNPGAKGQKPTSWQRLRTRATQVLTPLWWGVTAVALSALGLALLTHWVELAVIGLVLGVLALLSPLSALGLGKHNINLYVQNERVVVGDNAYGELQATNAGTRRTRKAVMELPVGKSTADVLVPSLRAGQMISQPLAIPTARRGLVSIGPVRSVNGDGLGLVRRERRWSQRIELYVHPRTVALESEAIGFIKDIEGATIRDLSSSDVSFHTLREYVPGDDRRNIHWKSTAHTGKLMVRQFEETRRAHLLVVLDTRAASWASEAEFEVAVSAAASLIVATIKASREVTLVTQAGVPALPNPKRALDALSLVEMDGRAADLPELTKEAVAACPGASVAVLITGSGADLELIERAWVRLPVSARSYVLRVSPGRAGRNRLGAMDLLHLGVLSELPALLRKAAL